LSAAASCTLEESLALRECGEKVADTCQRRLDGARARRDATRAERTAEPG
jgi:exodeoxyribonuclease VII small subunit